MKAYAKRAVISLLGSDPALSWKLHRIAKSGAVTVLNLHRVDDRRESAYETIRPDLFDELIGWLKQHFSIVTFAELDQARFVKPPLVLSFDDGYKDFIERVVPILEQHNVRVNQNIIPGCVERGLPPVNILLQDFINQAPAALLRKLKLAGLPRGIDPAKRAASGRAASAALKSLPIVEQKLAFEGLEKHFACFDAFRPTPLMSIDDIRQVVRLHEIGTHSYEHATMKFETDNYVAADAARCRDWHARKLGTEPYIYAFPNNSLGPRHADIVRSAGYTHILLVGEGYSTKESHIHSRFTMYGESASELRFRATGAMAAVRLENRGA